MRDRKYYRFTKAPKALLKARLGNIAIVPASMLPFTKTVEQVINSLPQGAVFLCHAEENMKQRRVLERVEASFKAHGHVVTNIPMEQIT